LINCKGAMKNIVKGSEALLQTLIEEGVSTIFGYPGGTMIPLYDELYNFKGKINHILVRHEQGAVHAAEGYARATGKVGVAIATSGPGATNLVTGIVDAFMDSTPLVCITAQVNLDKLGTDFFQEADIVGITIPATKWSYQITKASEITGIVSKAFCIASSGRPGPVLISITKNALVEDVDYQYVRYTSSRLNKQFFKTKLEVEISEAVRMINNAERPMIIAGQGVILSGAERELLKLAERGNIPVVSTLMGLSAVSSNHPLFMGMVGMHGNVAPNKMTQQSDLIVAVGMRFSDRVTGNTEKYAPNAKIIHIDIDKAEFNKNVKVDLPLWGDARGILGKIAPEVKFNERKEWFSFISEYLEKERKMIINKLMKHDPNGMISMAQAVDCVARLSGGEAIIVTDVGQNQMFGARYSKFNGKRSFITSGGLGTMGYGLPASIGAKMGVPDKEVVLITGDGGFQMSIQELGTILQSQIKIKILLLNNSYLGMVRQWQQLFYDKRYSFTELINPDFMKIAQAYNIASRKIEHSSELEEGVTEMLSSEGSFLLEVVVKREENVFPMVPSGASLDESIYNTDN